MSTIPPNLTDSIPDRELVSDHPLVLIPFFRRWKPGFVRDLIYTFILGLGFCLFFFALFGYDDTPEELVGRWWRDFIIAMAISFTIHFFYLFGEMLLARWLQKTHVLFRSAFRVIVSIAGVYVGYFIGIIAPHPAAVHYNFVTRSVILSVAVMSIMVACVVLFLFQLQERELRDKEQLALEQSRVLESERRALEAQLRMLQAQIEPHFLYNTLANAVGLIQPAPDRARLLLERLIDYLRATLAASRDIDATLQGEIDTVAAYLELMKLRMGERLRYRIDVADEALALSMPPMLLQPVIENAISHGLEPKIEGGEIVLTARVDATHLRIVIDDTGVGFRSLTSAKVGGGVGLSNLRERIGALYGGDGSFIIADNAAGGVSVTLRIPLQEPVAHKGEI